MKSKGLVNAKVHAVTLESTIFFFKTRVKYLLNDYVQD